MKVLILTALKEWIIKNYGPEKWDDIGEGTGLGAEEFTKQAHYINQDRFGMARKYILNALMTDELTLNKELADYWMTDFAPRIYNHLIKRSETMKDFIMGTMQMNNDFCTFFPNAKMAKIDFSQTGSKSISAIYPSENTLVDLIGVLRASSTFFPQKFNIRKINPHSIEIIFE